VPRFVDQDDSGEGGKHAEDFNLGNLLLDKDERPKRRPNR
jgi:hypothetical protein